MNYEKVIKNQLLTNLTELEFKFIDCVYIDLNKYNETADKLNISLSDVQELNKRLDPVWRPISKIRAKWKAKNIGGDFWDFYIWHNKAEKQCYYCGITPDELNHLHEIGIVNKRETRGRVLELDRKKPNEPYSDLNNLTYSCYWCNNAKTDTFTEDEFKLIGQAIRQVWKKRLLP
jgi:hypothetical protein